jgi:hypothetical protein
LHVTFWKEQFPVALITWIAIQLLPAIGGGRDKLKIAFHKSPTALTYWIFDYSCC